MTPKENVINIETYLTAHGLQNSPSWLEIKQALTKLEELKQRDTKMKLTQASRFTTDKKIYGMYACNSCHEVIPYITLNSKRVKPKFCYHCGQRLDWRNWNEQHCNC